MKQLKKLKNFPNYAATPDGLIWSYTTNKFLSPQKHKVGYIYVSIYKNKKQYKKYKFFLKHTCFNLRLSFASLRRFFILFY